MGDVVVDRCAVADVDLSEAPYEVVLAMPLLAKIRMLCRDFGGSFEGQPCITDMSSFGLAFREDVDMEHLLPNLSQSIRNSAEYVSGDFALSRERQRPKYRLDVVPVLLRCIGVVVDNYQWQSVRSGIVSYMAERHGPFAVEVCSAAQTQASARKKQNVELVAALKNERRKRQRLEDQVDDLKAQLAAAQDPYACGVMASHNSQNAFYDKVPVWRGVYLCLRRIAARVSASKLGLSVGIDIHPSTVTWWELQVHAAQVGHAMEFHKGNDAIAGIYEGTLQSVFDVTSLFFIRCDATNANVWQKSKLHCLTLESSFRYPRRARPNTFMAVAELLAISSSDGESLVALIEKQVRSLGAPTWGDVPATQQFLTAYVMCTDAGGDIAKARRIISAQTPIWAKYVIFLDVDCLQHQYSLAMGDLLKLTDSCLAFLLKHGDDPSQKPLRYCATLVKLFNVWREFAVAVHYIWKDMYPETLHHAQSMPPKCLPHRWGSKEDCEQKLLSLPLDHFVAVLRVALDKRLRKIARRLKVNEGDISLALEFYMSIDEAQVTNKGHYADRMNKMAIDAMRGVESPEFESMARISHHVTGPWREFREYLQQHNTLVRETGMGSFAHLVCGHAEVLRSKVVALLDEGQWASVLAAVKPSLQDACRQCVFAMASKSLAVWELRVSSRMNSLKASLLTVAKSNPSTPCDSRRAFAQRLLAAGELAEDPSMAKLRELAVRELEHCAETGCVSFAFYRWVRDLGGMWRCDTEFNEGLNNIIKNNVDSAPRISLELLSARLALQVAMNAATQMQKMSRSRAIKWSDVQYAVSDLCDSLIATHHNVETVLAVQDRFVAPAPLPLPAIVAASPAARQLGAALVPWAHTIDASDRSLIAALNMVWLRKWQEATKDASFLSANFIFGHQDDLQTGWKCVSTVGYTGVLFRCEILSDDTAPLLEPVEQITSLDFIRDFCLEGAKGDGAWLWLCKPVAESASGKLIEEDLTA